jgi:hypothetical protein
VIKKVRRLLSKFAGGCALAGALSALAPLEATHAACELALSSERRARLAIASALEHRFRLVGDDVVIEHLAADDDPEIRRAAARAAWIRRTDGVDPTVLARLVHDPDPMVRDIAALAAPHR